LLSPAIENRGLKFDFNYTVTVCALIRDRVYLIPDLWNNSWFFFIPPSEYSQQVKQKIWKPETPGLVNAFLEEAGKLVEWNKDNLHAMLEVFLAGHNAKMGQLMNPLRLLVVGDNQGPGMTDIAGILGKEETVRRIGVGLEKI
jgi:glutamyl-tRNA synthetase